MSNFLTRSITGIVFVIVMVAGIWSNFYSLCLLFGVIVTLALFEFYTLLERSNAAQPLKLYSTATGVILFISFCLFAFYHNPHLLLISVPFVFLVPIIELFRDKKNSFNNIAFSLFGILYLTIPFAIWPILCLAANNKQYSPVFLLSYFFFIWGNDTFAYLVGKVIGKTKLFERISPKKTWEGTIGGGILTLGIAYIISLYFKEISTINWIVVAAIVVVTGTLGDLVESMFKRSLNVKDSGNILPGHGGILDRFDGVLLSSPFVFTYLIIIH